MKAKLFIDFDGVLNHNDWWHCGVPGTTPGMPGRAIEPEPAAVLNVLSEVADEIWIISAWARWMYQHGLTTQAFCEMAFAHGLILHHDKIRHFGQRADHPSDRAAFILRQVHEAVASREPFSFAIVDDCDMGPHLGPHGHRFMRVDSRFMLRRCDLPRLIEWLRSPLESKPA